MSNVVTYVEVDQKSAILNGRAVWGKQPLTDREFEAVLAELTTEERSCLVLENSLRVRVGDYSRYVSVDSLQTQDIVAGIRNKIKECKVKHEQDIQKDDEKLQRIVQNPEKFIDKLDVTLWTTNFLKKMESVASVSAAHQSLNKFLKQKVAAWAECVCITLKEAEPIRSTKVEFEGCYYNLIDIKLRANEYDLPEVKQALDHYNMRIEALASVKKELEAESKKAWKNLALCVGSEELKLAIENDYPVGNRIEKEVMASFLPVAPEGTEIREKVSDLGDRRVPNLKAHKLCQELKKGIANIESVVPIPQGTSINVGRISSVEFYIECPCGGAYNCNRHDSDGEIEIKRTAIPVTITAHHVNKTFWYVIEE